MTDEEQMQFQGENTSRSALSEHTIHAVSYREQLHENRIATTSLHTMRHFPKSIRINLYKLKGGKCYRQCNTLHGKVRRLLVKHKTFLK